MIVFSLKMATKRRFSHLHALLRPDETARLRPVGKVRVGEVRRRRVLIDHATLVLIVPREPWVCTKTRRWCVSNFLRVCPELVLANDRFQCLDKSSFLNYRGKTEAKDRSMHSHRCTGRR